MTVCWIKSLACVVVLLLPLSAEKAKARASDDLPSVSCTVAAQKLMRSDRQSTEIGKALEEFRSACSGWDRLLASAQVIEDHNRVIADCLKETVLITDLLFTLTENDVTIRFEIENITAHPLKSLDVVAESSELEALFKGEELRFQWNIAPPLSPSELRTITYSYAINSPHRGSFDANVVAFLDIEIEDEIGSVIRQNNVYPKITHGLLERFGTQLSDFCR